MRAARLILLSIGVASLAATVGGCVILPLPHRVRVQPEVKGRVLDTAGNPVSGVPLYLRSVGPERGVTSDADGYFEIPAEWRWHLWGFVLFGLPLDVACHDDLVVNGKGPEGTHQNPDYDTEKEVLRNCGSTRLMNAVNWGPDSHVEEIILAPVASP